MNKLLFILIFYLVYQINNYGQARIDFKDLPEMRATKILTADSSESKNTHNDDLNNNSNVSSKDTLPSKLFLTHFQTRNAQYDKINSFPINGVGYITFTISNKGLGNLKNAKCILTNEKSSTGFLTFIDSVQNISLNSGETDELHFLIQSSYLVGEGKIIIRVLNENNELLYNTRGKIKVHNLIPKDIIGIWYAIEYSMGGGDIKNIVNPSIHFFADASYEFWTAHRNNDGTWTTLNKYRGTWELKKNKIKLTHIDNSDYTAIQVIEFYNLTSKGLSFEQEIENGKIESASMNGIIIIYNKFPN